jgi:rhamnosyltransferase
MSDKVKAANKKHVFIVGAKSIGQYGGYESFLDRLTEQHQDNKNIQYYIITKANGESC